MRLKREPIQGFQAGKRMGILLFGAMLKEFFACKAGWELHNSSSANQTPKIPQEIVHKDHFFTAGGEETAISILGENKLCLL